MSDRSVSFAKLCLDLVIELCASPETDYHAAFFVVFYRAKFMRFKWIWHLLLFSIVVGFFGYVFRWQCGVNLGKYRSQTGRQ